MKHPLENAPSRYLILSLGSIGRRHLRNLRLLRPDASIAVQRRNPESSLPEGADRQFASLDEARAFRPHAAIIAGPASTHVQAAIGLAGAGIPLLIEKPLGDRLDGVEDVLKLCRQNSLTLMIGYTLRFSPSLREVRRILGAGGIGQVVAAQADVGQYLPDWRPDCDYRDSVTARRDLGGGALLELSHELDYIYWLFGLPRRICARGGRYGFLDLDVEDLVDITLEYEEPRRQVCVHLDLLQRAPRRGARFIGTDGTLLWNALTDEVELYCADTGQWERQRFAVPDRNQMYLDELRHFLECVETGAEPLITGEAGADVLRLVFAARRSMAEGRVVEVLNDA